MRDVEVSNWTEIISAEAFFSSYAYSFESQIFPSRYIHCKCLQGITGTLQENRSAGISKGLVIVEKTNNLGTVCHTKVKLTFSRLTRKL